MRIGIDLGGTKTEGILLDAHGAEVGRVRVPSGRNYDGTLDTIVSLVEQLDERAGHSRSAIGLGIPGATVPSTGLVKNANSTWLIGKPLLHDLEQRLHRKVRCSNDANCFALSEATDGAGAGAAVVFGVILGTGVGGGIVVHGHVIDGPNLLAGEWGHNPLPWQTDSELRNSVDCYCGKSGCIETWLSGPGFETHFRIATGRTLTSREIVALAASDSDARAALAAYGSRLARALATIVNSLDPDVIVLGGGMSNIPGLADCARRELDEWTFSPAPATRIVRNTHGDSSGVRGAAWLHE